MTVKFNCILLDFLSSHIVEFVKVYKLRMTMRREKKQNYMASRQILRFAQDDDAA